MTNEYGFRSQGMSKESSYLNMREPHRSIVPSSKLPIKHLLRLDDDSEDDLRFDQLIGQNFSRSSKIDQNEEVEVYDDDLVILSEGPNDNNSANIIDSINMDIFQDGMNDKDPNSFSDMSFTETEHIPGDGRRKNNNDNFRKALHAPVPTEQNYIQKNLHKKIGENMKRMSKYHNLSQLTPESRISTRTVSTTSKLSATGMEYKKMFEEAHERVMNLSREHADIPPTTDHVPRKKSSRSSSKSREEEVVKFVSKQILSEIQSMRQDIPKTSDNELQEELLKDTENTITTLEERLRGLEDKLISSEQQKAIEITKVKNEMKMQNGEKERELAKLRTDNEIHLVELETLQKQLKCKQKEVLELKNLQRSSDRQRRKQREDFENKINDEVINWNNKLHNAKHEGGMLMKETKDEYELSMKKIKEEHKENMGKLEEKFRREMNERENELNGKISILEKKTNKLEQELTFTKDKLKVEHQKYENKLQQIKDEADREISEAVRMKREESINAIKKESAKKTQLFEKEKRELKEEHTKKLNSFAQETDNRVKAVEQMLEENEKQINDYKNKIVEYEIKVSNKEKESTNLENKINYMSEKYKKITQQLKYQSEERIEEEQQLNLLKKENQILHESNKELIKKFETDKELLKKDFQDQIVNSFPTSVKKNLDDTVFLLREQIQALQGHLKKSKSPTPKHLVTDKGNVVPKPIWLDERTCKKRETPAGSGRSSRKSKQ
ncbi:hypothetical protein SNEBB_003201 [Seison nebaliae]|nr:hypothetical protein SNEBB_003201 [Seison nebaliae]